MYVTLLASSSNFANLTLEGENVMNIQCYMMAYLMKRDKPDRLDSCSCPAIFLEVSRWIERLRF